MKNFLVFLMTPYRLMVDAMRVRELQVLGAVERISGGHHVAWRGALVTEINLRTLLGGKGEQGSVDIIYGGDDDEEPPVIFRVDRVIGIRGIRQEDIKPVPPLTHELCQFFDGLYLEPTDGKGILRLVAGPDVLRDLWRKQQGVMALPRLRAPP